MVLIEAPEGWSLEGPSEAAAIAAPATPPPAVVPPTVNPVPAPPPVAPLAPPTTPVVKAKPIAPAIQATAAASGTSAPKVAASAPIAPAVKAATSVQPPPAPVAPTLASPTPVMASADSPVAGTTSTEEAEAWPKWFLPGLGACLALGLLVLIVRLVFQPSDEAESIAVAPPVTSTPVETIEPKAPATEAPAQTETSPPVAELEQPKQPEIETSPAVEVPKTPAKEVEAPASEIPRTAALPDGAPMPEVAPAVSAPMVAVAPPEPSEDKSAVPDQPESSLSPQSLQRVAPKLVNIQERLDDSLPALEIRNMPLVSFARLIGDLVGAPISLDVDELRALGHSAATPVSLQLKDVTLGQALESALEPLNLSYEERDGMLVVGATSHEMRRTRYRIPDLASDQAALSKFAALVEQFVAPASWNSAGGQGNIAQESDALLVDQTPPVLGQILDFCEKIRVARNLPIKSRFPASRFELTPRREKAANLLNRSVTANFGSPVPLAKVVSWLEDATGATILVDHASLARSGTSVDSESRVVAVDQSLAATLDQLLKPMDLTWRAVDENTVEVTTPQAAAEMMEIEFYPASKMAPDATSGNALVQSIRAQVEPSVWGDEAGQAAIYFDLPSRSLIVRAPQAVQNRVQAFLQDP